MIIDSAFLPIISFSSDSEAFIMFFKVLNFFISFFVVAGPMFGKPSNMNWTCSFFVLKIFDALIGKSVFLDFFARTERY